MKKFLTIAIICLSFCLISIQITKAEEYYYQEVIEILDIQEHETRAVNTITGKKTASFKNSSGKVLWSVSVTGKFTYTGSKATCTNSSVSASSNSSFWKILSKSSSKSANKALANAKAGNYLEGKLIMTQSKTVTLTCSSSGKLS